MYLFRGDLEYEYCTIVLTVLSLIGVWDGFRNILKEALQLRKMMGIERLNQVFINSFR